MVSPCYRKGRSLQKRKTYDWFDLGLIILGFNLHQNRHVAGEWVCFSPFSVEAVPVLADEAITGRLCRAFVLPTLSFDKRQVYFYLDLSVSQRPQCPKPIQQTISHQ